MQFGSSTVSGGHAEALGRPPRRESGGLEQSDGRGAPALESLAAVVAVARRDADSAERSGRLTAALVDELRRLDVSRAFVPRVYGGMEADPIWALRAVEEVSYGDGSAGWCVMVAIQLGFLACYLPPFSAAEIYGPRGAWVAGVGSASGTAVTKDRASELVVSGHWHFASGIEHADWVHASILVQPGTGDDQTSPARRMVFVPASCCKLIRSWSNTLGLRATGSHQFELDAVHVPNAFGYDIMGGRAEPRISGPLYRFKIGNYILHGAQAIGVARNAVYIVWRAVGEPSGAPVRESPLFLERYAEADSIIMAARAHLYELASAAWKKVANGGDLVPAEVSRLWIASTHAVQTSARAAAVILDAIGSRGLFPELGLERCFRDLHTAARHVNVSEAMKASAARALVGLPSGLKYF